MKMIEKLCSHKKIVANLRATSAKLSTFSIGFITFFAIHSHAFAQTEAEQTGPLKYFNGTITASDLIQFSLFSGSMIAAMASALWLIRERGRIAEQNTKLRTKIGQLTSRMNQLEALSCAEGQMAIVWTDDESKPEIVGTLEPECGTPTSRGQLLAFGRWLEPKSAAIIDHSIEDLRKAGKTFNEVLETTSNMPIEVSGRTSGRSAIVRFSNLAGERKSHAQLVSAHERVVNTVEMLQSLMDKTDMPIWLRDMRGQLSWVNKAYAKLVEKEDNASVIDEKAELFGAQALRTMSQSCEKTGTFHDILSTVVAGDRMKFDVVQTNGKGGSAGIGLDKSETEAVRYELSKTIRSHEETLDELTTAVAMFDESEKIQFHNSAFATLWSLDAAFLEQRPNISMFLDRLRTEGQLPEQPEWRRWKDELLSAFRATEPQEHWWHLTDGRTVRVIANPHPKGGLTWVFENLTEQIDLESRVKSMARVQGETLDHLAEGVAVFGTNGRLQLANPAFENFWQLKGFDPQNPLHISDITKQIADRGDDASAWEEFAGSVTGFNEDRSSGAGRVIAGEATLSWMIVPLPNGQTMITFVDVTAADQIERALRERNEALERTAHLKNRFIRHVSYELRSPLTSIMGFTDLISMENIGKLNEKQREYIGHIEMSSKTLLDTTDDILDLASVDAGVIDLAFETVDIEPAMREAVDLLEERFKEYNIDLSVRVEPDIGSIVADRTRLVQVMRNVLANAADFAPEASTVSFTAERIEEGVVFKIRDKGRGIDPDAAEEVFERFHTENAGRRRGAGLGLAIVKSFVDLHDGKVMINSELDNGTEVILQFPQIPSQVSVAAE